MKSPKLQKNIRNIIFDLGGVLVDIDASRTINAFKKLGLPDLVKEGGWDYHHEIFLQLEKGQISTTDFRNEIRNLLPDFVSDEEIDKAWCAIIIDFPPEKIELLKELKSQYRLFLFSNTNAIHVNHFHKLFEDKFGHPMSDIFEKEFFSNEMKLRKPSIDSFHYILNNEELKPEETLFIDDLKENAEAARETGMQTVWLSPNLSFPNIFYNYL